MRGRPKKEAQPVQAADLRPDTTPRELFGFRLFRAEPQSNQRTNTIGVWISETAVRLSNAAQDALGQPQQVLAFFDDHNRRMMLQPCDAAAPYGLKLSKKSSGRACVIQRQSLIRQILRMCGREQEGGRYWIPGHAAATVQPSLIFSLEDIERLENREG